MIRKGFNFKSVLPQAPLKCKVEQGFISKKLTTLAWFSVVQRDVISCTSKGA